MAKTLFFDSDRITQLDTLIADLVKQGLSRNAIIQKAYAFNDQRCDPPFPDTRIIGMVTKAFENTDKQDKPPQVYHDGERRYQLAHVIKKGKAQGADADTILQEVRAFNKEKNVPPLSDSDIKHLTQILVPSVKKNVERVSLYETRTVNLSNGKKIKMRGADIIGVE